jgi:hypothetical protein
VCSPRVGLLAQLEVDERLGGGHPRHRADLLEDLQQVVVVARDHLGEQVERARGDHHVVDRGDLREPVRGVLQLRRCAQADHRLAGEAQLERVGDRDDLHHARVQQPLHPLAHGRLGQPHRAADRGVGPATVLLQLLDDPLGDVVEQRVLGTLPNDEPATLRCGFRHHVLPRYPV